MPQYPLKAVKHGGASWHGAVSLTMVLGLFTTYQESWINLLVSEYLQGSCFPMLKRKSPWDGCFNKTTTPNIPVSEQHIGSRPTKLQLWCGQLNPRTLIQNVTSKMLFWREDQEIYIERNRGIVERCQTILGWNTCLQVPEVGQVLVAQMWSSSQKQWLQLSLVIHRNAKF